MANALMRTYRDVQQRLGKPEIEFGRTCPDLPDSAAWNRTREQPTDKGLRPVTAAASPTIPLRPERPVEYPGPLRDDGLHVHGMEAVAFYKSFRFQDLHPFQGHWGIFYLTEGIRVIHRHLEEIDIPHAEWSALEFVRRHERFHFKFDVYALGIESAVSKHLFVPPSTPRHHAPREGVA